MLNTSKAPFNNKTLRQAMAMCVNQAQYSKVIDKSIDAPMNGLFLPGSEQHQTVYPKYNPTQAAKLVKQVQQQTGTSQLHSQFDERSGDLGGRPVPAAGLADGGMKVTITILAQATIIDDVLAGTYEATLWRQFPAVDPDLNYVCGARRLSARRCLEHGPQQRPQDSTALVAEETNDKPDRIKSDQAINQYLAEDIPYLWLARYTGPSWPAPTCRTSPIPPRCRVRRPSPTTKACSGRPRLDVLGRSRRMAVDGPGLPHSTSSRYSSRQSVKRSSGRRRQ